MSENDKNKKYLVDQTFDNEELLIDSIRAEIELGFRDFEKEIKKIENQK